MDWERIQAARKRADEFKDIIREAQKDTPEQGDMPQWKTGFRLGLVTAQELIDAYIAEQIEWNTPDEAFRAKRPDECRESDAKVEALRNLREFIMGINVLRPEE